MGAPATAPSPMVRPDDRADAPGQLALVEAFLNTYEVDGDEETLTGVSVLEDWLRDRRLITADDHVRDPADLDRALAVREALRELALANHGDRAAMPAALDVLTREARAAPLAVDLSGGDHAHLTPAGEGIDRALGALFGIVFHAMHDGTWDRLKACRSETCRWAFYDTSRNRSGKWCDMAVCGNRNKVASYRERHG